MKRAWRFCGVCGCRVYGPAAMLEAPSAYCPEHAQLVRDAERLPRDVLERVPTRADDIERALRGGEAQ